MGELVVTSTLPMHCNAGCHFLRCRIIMIGIMRVIKRATSLSHPWVDCGIAFSRLERPGELWRVSVPRHSPVKMHNFQNAQDPPKDPLWTTQGWYLSQWWLCFFSMLHLEVNRWSNFRFLMQAA